MCYFQPFIRKNDRNIWVFNRRFFVLRTNIKPFIELLNFWIFTIRIIINIRVVRNITFGFKWWRGAWFGLIFALFLGRYLLPRKWWKYERLDITISMKLVYYIIYLDLFWCHLSPNSYWSSSLRRICGTWITAWNLANWTILGVKAYERQRVMSI